MRISHDFYDRDDGLQHCKVCNGAEGSLTTDCPGRRMTDAEEERVYDGEIDFKDGQWISTVTGSRA
jgi:hypothetical protein